jgi:hypothetical protein
LENPLVQGGKKDPQYRGTQNPRKERLGQEKSLIGDPAEANKKKDRDPFSSIRQNGMVWGFSLIFSLEGLIYFFCL